MGKNKDIHDSELFKVAEAFQILANPTRLRILIFLYRKEKATINDLKAEIDLSVSTLREHLHYLVKSDMVETLPIGKFTYYRLKKLMK